jgi:hypothetical protein
MAVVSEEFRQLSWGRVCENEAAAFVVVMYLMGGMNLWAWFLTWKI